MSSNRKPNPQRSHATACWLKPCRPSESTDRCLQFGQMKNGTRRSYSCAAVSPLARPPPPAAPSARWLARLLARLDQRLVEVAFALRELPLGVEGGNRAGAGRGDRLPVDVVLHVAGREDAGDVRLGRARLRD